MENFYPKFILSAITIGGFSSFLIGAEARIFSILLAAMVLDTLSGLLKAIKHKKLRSFIMSWGIIKKGGIILAVMLSILLDYALNNEAHMFTNMMTWFAIANEGLSIVENLHDIGVSMPSIIIDKLLNLSDADSDEYKNNPFYRKEEQIRIEEEKTNKEG